MSEKTDSPSAEQLLHWLDTLPVPDGYGWKFRRSTTGRGWRLLTTTERPNYGSPQMALEVAYDECRLEMEVLDKMLDSGEEDHVEA